MHDFTKPYKERSGLHLLWLWIKDLLVALAIGLLFMSPVILQALDRHFGWGLN